MAAVFKGLLNICYRFITYQFIRILFQFQITWRTETRLAPWWNLCQLYNIYDILTMILYFIDLYMHCRKFPVNQLWTCLLVSLSYIIVRINVFSHISNFQSEKSQSKHFKALPFTHWNTPVCKGLSSLNKLYGGFRA